MVFVHDAKGDVHWYNSVSLGVEAIDNALRRANAEGRLTNILDWMPKEIALERLEQTRLALDAPVPGPMPIEGWCWGQRRCTTLRPLPSIDNGPPSLVLTVCVPSASRSIDPERVTKAKHEDKGELGRLTEREVEVLTMIAKGMTTQQIADELSRSVKTVEWHRLSLGNKLSVTNRVELAQIAIRSGLVALT